MNKPLEFYTETVSKIAACLEAKEPWSRKVSVQRRTQLLTFIDDPNAEVDEAFMDAFNKIVDHLGEKINLKLFEIVLKVGVNFAPPGNDAYWFALFECNDYGSPFDQPELCQLLLDEVFLSNANSWKAACLLCILVQDYGAARAHASHFVRQDQRRVYKLFQEVKDYAACSYLVELLSQIEAPEMVQQIFPSHLKTKIVAEVYSNDKNCRKFLEQFSADVSITHFKALSIEGALSSGPSTCQLVNDVFVALVDHNDHAAPVQFDPQHITNVQHNGCKVRFHLDQAPRALLSVDIPALTNVDMEFYSVKEAQATATALEKISKKFMMSTPRKISVVQDFIKVSSKLYEGGDDEEEVFSSLSDAILTQSSPQAHIGTAASGDVAAIVNVSASEIDEDETMFGSPVNNTTKDTSTSRHGRAVSVAIAEAQNKPSSRVSGKDQSLGSDIPLSKTSGVQIPDSLDLALDVLDNAKTVPVAPLKYAKPKVANQKKANANNRMSSNDIWDFDDSPENDGPDSIHSSRAVKSKAMKFLKKPIIEKTVKPKNTHLASAVKTKSVVQKKLENVSDLGPHNTRDLIAPSSDSRAPTNESEFSGLTSPLVSRNERAASRALSLRGADSAEDGDAQSLPKKRKLNDADDDSYEPTQIVEKPPVKKATGDFVEPSASSKRITRSVKGKEPLKIIDENKESSPARDPETSKPMTVSQIFASSPVQPKAPVKKNAPVKKAAPLKKKAPLPNKAKAQAVRPVSTIAPTPVIVPAPAPAPTTLPPLIHKAVPDPVISPPSREQLMSSVGHADFLDAHALLSEAYTTTLQQQIYESINAFSSQLVKKIQIINDEINKKVMTDLTTKYETLFNDLRESFQGDVDEMCGFIGDVKGLLNLPEQLLVEYIKKKKFGQITDAEHGQ